jgi:hypothetical protein
MRIVRPTGASLAGGGDVSDVEGYIALKTPRIARRGGLSAEPLSPFVPVTGRQITQRDRVTYSMPFEPIRRLTERNNLGEFDYQLLNDIEAVANSAHYLGDIRHRSELSLHTELRTSNALTTHSFRGGK